MRTLDILVVTHHDATDLSWLTPIRVEVAPGTRWADANEASSPQRAAELFTGWLERNPHERPSILH